MFTIPFKYLLETVHRDLPSIALDYNYIKDAYQAWNLNDDQNLTFLFISVILVLVKEYFLLLIVMKMQTPNNKFSYLSKGIKSRLLSQTFYYLHYMLVRAVLTVLVFISTGTNTLILLGINMSFQLIFTAFHLCKIFDNFLLYFQILIFWELNLLVISIVLFLLQFQSSPSDKSKLL